MNFGTVSSLPQTTLTTLVFCSSGSGMFGADIFCIKDELREVGLQLAIIFGTSSSSLTSYFRVKSVLLFLSLDKLKLPYFYGSRPMAKA